MLKWRLSGSFSMYLALTTLATATSRSPPLGPWLIGDAWVPSSSKTSPPSSTKATKWQSTCAPAWGVAVCPPVALACEAMCNSLASASILPATSGLCPRIFARNLMIGASASSFKASALLTMLCSIAMVPHALAMYCFR
eukprot:CAMPEP_0180793620 /NCGR_PEP_ID=MMETSP1038_2-20121128/55109_1 /TAXON_ID=632150 /ORGANISM="Azadinium spinosum, Strain 3D9" /LENGTH=138 /DNA_ID=CAMNT_0022832177 /DNA_START=30 /DNA_END=446 /DNA_ORIENTATION=-